MKNLIKRLLAFTVCAAMLLSFAGCGKDEEAIDAGEGLGTSKLADGESIENENYILKWVAEENCPVLISKATGAQWSTTPAEILNQTNDEKVVRARNYLESPFIVEYYDSVLGEPDSVRAYTDCIRDANFSATKDGSEMVVEYYFEDVNIFIPVHYILKDEGMAVSIDANEVIEAENPIYKITFAPYFCSVKTGTADSYLFYPSGTGAIIDTTNPAMEQVTYSAEVYGLEAARKVKEKLTNDKNVYLPVFGAKAGDNGVCAVISSGMEQAALTLTTNDNVTGYSNIAPEFYLRGYDYNTIKGNLTYDETSIYAEERVFDTVFTVDFYPLAGDDADYVGMSKVYQKYLYGNNDANKNITDESVYSIKFIGGLMEQRNFLGFPYNSLLALTTYADVSSILTELSATGQKPNIQLYGFGSSGLDVGEVAGGFKLGGAFGSKKELKNVINYCTENGIDSFVDFNLIQFSSGSLGYSATFNAAKTANQQTAYQYYYSKAVQVQDTVNYDRFKLLQRDSVIKAANKLFGKIQKYSLTGVSFASLSDTAYSDYSSEKYYVKRDMANFAKGIINTYTEGGYNFAANGANEYAAVLADCIFEAPMNSSEHEIFTVDVPFYQLVFKGKTEITSESVNAGEVLQKKQLQALETGSSMLFSIYNTYDSTLTYSPFKGLYGAMYADNKDNIIAAATEYADYYKAISGQTIANHELLTEKVRLTTFSGGVKIYVNYSDADYHTADGVVPAMDCLIIK